MLTCLEIINILYMKCNDLCNSLKFKFDSVFNENRNRPYRYNNNFNNNFNNSSSSSSSDSNNDFSSNNSSHSSSNSYSNNDGYFK